MPTTSVGMAPKHPIPIGDGSRLLQPTTPCSVLFFLILPLLPAAAPNGGREPAAEPDRLRGEVARLLHDLDSDRFEVRDRAAQRLEEMVGKPDLGPLLAAEFQRRLVRPDLSFEVRRRLMRWSRQLPSPPAGAARQRLAQGTGRIAPPIGRRFLRRAAGGDPAVGLAVGQSEADLSGDGPVEAASGDRRTGHRIPPPVGVGLAAGPRGLAAERPRRLGLAAGVQGADRPVAGRPG